MIIHTDGCSFPDQARKFYSQLQREKEFVWGDGSQFDYYDQPKQVNSVVENAIHFFSEHLK